MIEVFLVTYWQQTVAAIAFIVWAIRLEAKVNNNTKETHALKDQMEVVEKHRSDQRKEDMEQIHRTLIEIRADIKQIMLREHGKG